MHDLLRDLRFALRRLRRRPGWALSIVAVLALGLAGNAAMFSGFDAWVLRPLDFERPQELLQLGSSQPTISGEIRGLSPPDWYDLVQSHSELFELAVFDRGGMFNVDDDVEPTRMNGARIDHRLLPLLGREPALGRGLLEADDLPGAPAPVVIIGDRLWRERFAADPRVLGRTLRVDGVVHEIVGVMPPGFEFPEWGSLWLPLGLAPERSPRDSRWLTAVARQRPGATIDSVAAALEGIGADLERLHPETNTGWRFVVTPLRDLWVPAVIEVALGVSLAAATMVLLVICANVSSLFLAEVETRGKELSVRSALGASRLQLVRPFLFESAVLALFAFAVGALLSQLMLRAMLGRVPLDPPYLFAMRLDWRALAFTLVIALAAGFLCVLAPILRSSGRGVSDALRTGGSGSLGRSAARLRGGLVVAEVAFSSALVLCSLLMAKSLLQQRSIDPGYRTAGVVAAELSLTGPELESADARRLFLERLGAGLSSSSMVTGVAYAAPLPSAGCRQLRYEAEGRPAQPGEGVPACLIAASADFFDTLDIAVRSGRTFTAEETEVGDRATLVSTGFARRLFASTDAVGRRMREVGEDDGTWMRVVGVVEDVAHPRDMVRDGASADVQVYSPYAAQPRSSVSVVVRSTAPALRVGELIREQIRAAGPRVPVSDILTMKEEIWRAQWVTRFFSEQLGMYAISALLVAAFGLYGLTSDSVARRRFEIAVRMSLGARRREVLALVLKRGAWLIVGGLAAGLPLALAFGRFGSAMLGGVSVWDPAIHAIVVLTLAAAAAVATALPARRASSVDPALVLRGE